jgi:magnesium-transporting ATPase (P-type)
LPGTQVERPWAAPAEAVADALATDSAAGLTATEAADRLERVGPNELVERGRKPAWRLNAVVGFVQKYRAEQAMAAGRSPKATRQRRTKGLPAMSRAVA